MLPMKKQEHAHSQSLCMMSRPGSVLIRMPCVVAPTKALRGRPVSKSTRRPEKGYCSPPRIFPLKGPEYEPTPRRESHSAVLTVLGTDNNVPSTVVKSLPQRDVRRRRLPHTAVLVQDGLRQVGGGREADHLVGTLVVVARVDRRAFLAAHAGAPPAARLVAEGRLGRVVLSKVLDAVLDGALVDMVEVRDVAADDVRLLGRG